MPEVIIRHVRGSAVAGVVAALAVSAAAVTASATGTDATDTDDLTVVVTVPAKGPGRLMLSVADHGAAVTLGAAGNGGDRLRFDGDLPQLTVTDSRSAERAGDGGWGLTGQAAAFTASAGTVTAGHLGWAPQVLTPTSGVTPGDRVATTLDDGPGLATPATLASADAEGRLQPVRLSAGLFLEVPVDTAPGTYRGAVTVSLFPVD